MTVAREADRRTTAARARRAAEFKPTRRTSIVAQAKAEVAANHADDSKKYTLGALVVAVALAISVTANVALVALR